VSTPRPKHYMSVSGGKDSTAAALLLREKGIEYEAIFLETGWEHPKTYEYLISYLPKVVGPIRWVLPPLPELSPEVEEIARALERRLAHPLGHPCGFVRTALHARMMPGSRMRFCTRLLKIAGIKEVFADAPPLRVNVVGVRAEESKARSDLPEHEISTSLDCMIWRPLISWSLQDVISIHKRHDVEPNPLYLGANRRVGCYPCIMANKADLRILGRDEERMGIIRDFEAAMTLVRGQEGKPGPLLRQRIPGRPDAPIDDVIEWSRTIRGGRQFPLFDTEEQGCVSWGLCER